MKHNYLKLIKVGNSFWPFSIEIYFVVTIKGELACALSKHKHFVVCHTCTRKYFFIPTPAKTFTCILTDQINKIEPRGLENMSQHIYHEQRVEIQLINEEDCFERLRILLCAEHSPDSEIVQFI
jgi:hypothetical protein